MIGELRTGRRRGERDTSRLEAFSDGVIAIAITLLVLDVRVPRLEGEERAHLWSALGDLWPSYFGYALSFTVIGIIWANHHDIFQHIARADRLLVLINTLFLLTVSFLPFPTALLAEYLGHEGERTAVIAYTGWNLMMALSFNLLWRYPRKAGLIDPEADPALVASITRRFDVGPPVYAVTFLVALVLPPVALVLSGLLALLYLLPVVLGRTGDAGADPA